MREMFLRIILFLAVCFLASCNSEKQQEYTSDDTLSNSMLFSQYYDNAVVDQKRGDVTEEAIIKFQSNDFTEATPLFKEIILKDSSNIAVWFYYGVANLELQDYKKSEDAFKTIIKNTDNLYVEHAEWYLGLCYLKANNVKDAIYQFNIVAADSTNYHNKDAKAILMKISQPINFLKELEVTEKHIKNQNERVDLLLANRLK
jgi:tetratricopeptide (TPR) repeat protein